MINYLSMRLWKLSKLIKSYSMIHIHIAMNNGMNEFEYKLKETVLYGFHYTFQGSTAWITELIKRPDRKEQREREREREREKKKERERGTFTGILNICLLVVFQELIIHFVVEGL